MNTIKGYHAHVYFDAGELSRAEALCAAAGERFNLKVGRMHVNPVGPHPRGSCQLAFSSNIFGEVVPWLLEHRSGLTVLLHGISGDAYVDHTDYTFWLGKQESLLLENL